ncbi:MAG: TrkH family potassium uptake protein, partial [Oscillospiraceae bacterium]|nr:TrkH family potassium uptake protein [Oscillospiraceae bacterium]
KAQDTALLLYGIYFAITIVLFLLLIIGGMSPLDSICHTFSTVGTGGFSTRSASTAYYGSAYIDTVLTVFMMICSVNFNIYFLVICGKLKEALKSEELRWLFIIYAVSGAVITFDLTPLYGSFGETLRYAAFQSASAMSTTGFASTNYGAWKHLAQAILIALMFVGGSAGSTAGGFKISRVLLIGKYMKRELSRTLHPKQVAVFRLEGSPVQEEAVRKAALYFSCYIAILFFSTIIICFDRFSLEASFLTVVSSFNNVGLSWGEISSTADFSVLSKLVLITDMLLGRLEILPIFLALSVSRH